MFPHVPLMSIKGPLGLVQLLETPILNCVNFPRYECYTVVWGNCFANNIPRFSLVVTNAVRFRNAVGEGKKLIEFGLRRYLLLIQDALAQIT